MANARPAGGGLRVAVDWRMVGRPGADDTDEARYQQALVAALAAEAAPGDGVWALICWPAAVDRLAPGIGHAGLGHRDTRLRRAETRDSLARLDADIAFFSQISPPASPVPVALVMHDALFATHPEWLGADARVRGRATSERALRDAEVVIAVSEAARTEVLSVLDIPPRCIRVVPPAVGAPFGPRAGAATRVAARFGLDRYCVAIGDPGPRGNFDQLAAAVARAGDPGLVVVSTRTARGRTRTSGEAGGIRYLGPVDDAGRADLLAAAWCAACVSFLDGCGIGALEALACGVPLLVSDRGALSEVSADAALVVPPTVNGIADGIRALREQALADQLRAAGPRRAAQFTSARMGRAAWGAARDAVASAA